MTSITTTAAASADAVAETDHEIALAAAMASDGEDEDDGDQIDNKNNDDDDDDDDSFVPDSLREFLQEAEQGLDDQIAYYLDSNTHAADPVAAGQQNHFFNDDDDDDDGEDDGEGENSDASLLHDLLQTEEAAAAAAAAATKAAVSKTPGTTEKRDGKATTPGLLDIMHPAMQASDSDVKRLMVNEGKESAPAEATAVNDSGTRSENDVATPQLDHSSAVAFGSVSASPGQRRQWGHSSTGSATSTTPSSTPQVGRKLQKELDREAQRASLPSSKVKTASSSSSFMAPTLSSSSDGLRRRRNRNPRVGVAPVSALAKSDGGGGSQRVVVQHQSLPPMAHEPVVVPTPSPAEAQSAKGNGGSSKLFGRLMGKPKVPQSSERRLSSSSPQQQPRSFKARPAPTPPKPKEINIPTPAAATVAGTATMTTAALPSSSGSSDVSPLGGIPTEHIDGAMDMKEKHGHLEAIPQALEAVFPKAAASLDMMSPKAQKSSSGTTPPKSTGTTDADGSKNGSKALGGSPAPVGRRPLTKPDFGLDRLVKPTTSSTSSAHVKRTKKSNGSTTSNISTIRRKINVSTSAITNSLEQTRKPTQSSSVTSRLMRPTAAVLARQNGDSGKVGAVTDTLVTDKTADNNALAASRNKARIRARIAAQAKKQQQEQNIVADREKTEKAKAAEQRYKESRERLKRMEEERLAKIKESIKAKNDRAQGKQLEHQHKHPESNTEKESIRSRNRRLLNRRASSRKKPSPTIPVAPKFATDLRLHQRDPGPTDQKNQDRLSLANSSDLLRQGLRAPPPKRQQASTFEGKRALTIPSTPNLETSKRHPGLKPTPTSPRKRELADDASWSSTLRDVCSPISKAGSQGGGSLTIPKGPNFQPIRKRFLPKSTAEKEQEEMEYFNSHPFRAKRPDVAQPPPSSSSRRSAPPRPLTTPEPFRFSLDGRTSSSRQPMPGDDKANSKTTTGFKARLMPKYSLSNGKTPLTGRPPTSRKRLTTPEPFHLHTENRAATHTPQITGHGGLGDSNIPSGSSGVPFRRREASTNEKDEGYKPFKALPLPDFIPKSIELKTGEESGEKISGRKAKREAYTESNATQEFRARKMPNFENLSIPVQHYLPVQLRSPPRNGKHEVDGVVMVPRPFHARPVPKAVLSPPQIPVKPRDPTKLRSPDSVKRPQQPKTENVTPTFHARPPPTSLTKEPSIPVVPRDPSKLRSPETAKVPSKSIGQVELPSKYHGPPPLIPGKPRDPSKLRSPESVKTPSPEKRPVDHPKSPSSAFLARQFPKSMSPQIEVRPRDHDKLHTPDESNHAPAQRIVDVTSAQKIDSSRVESFIEGMMDVSPVKTPSASREEQKRRLKERIAMRKKQGPTPVKIKSKSKATPSSSSPSTPLASASSKVQHKLNIGNEHLREKIQSERRTKVDVAKKTSGAVDVSVEEMVDDVLGTTISLPLESKKRHVTHGSEEFWDAQAVSDDGNAGDAIADAVTPKTRNVPVSALGRSAKEGGERLEEVELRRQAALACALGKPDEDESSSVLQLAQEIQRMAEDELSFHGSMPSSTSP